MKIDKPDFIGDILLNGNAGISGQVLISQGGGTQANWSDPSLASKLFLYTDKLSQMIVAGPSDVTWNQPASDAFNGVTLDVNSITFNLAANRLFKLTANITPSLANLAYSLSWVDDNNNPVGSLNQPANGLANLNHVHAFAIFKPLVNTKVKVRLTTLAALNLSILCSVFIESVV